MTVELDIFFEPEVDAGGRFACPSRRGRKLAHVVALDEGGEVHLPAHAEHLWDHMLGARVPVGARVRVDRTRGGGARLLRVSRRNSPRAVHGVYLGTWWTSAKALEPPPAPELPQGEA